MEFNSQDLGNIKTMERFKKYFFRLIPIKFDISVKILNVKLMNVYICPEVITRM